MNTSVMKRALFFITVCFLVNIGTISPRNNRKKKELVKTPITSTAYHGHLYQGLRKANDLLDYVLTVKGATKSVVLLSPFIYLYCSYYGVNPTSSIVNKVIQMIGNAKANYDIQLEIGKSQAFWDNLYSNPFSSVASFGSKLFIKTIYVGIPYMAGLLFKLGIGVK